MKNKRLLISGSLAVAISAIVICVAVVINILVGLLPEDMRKIHTNPEDMPKLGETTNQMIKGLKDEITIYHLYSESITGKDADGKEYVAPMDDKVVNIIEQYDKLSDKINVKTIDPVAYPDFMKKYTTSYYNQSSVIVESEKRFVFIDASNLYRWTIDQLGSTNYLTYEEVYNIIYYYYSQGGYINPEHTYFFGENEITRAIDYVTRDDIPTVYEMTGHNETTLDAGTFDSYLTKVNASLETLKVESGKSFAIPENAALFIINIPQKDITVEELEAVKAYLNGGGTVLLTSDLSAFTKEKMPNFSALCAYMGMEAIEGMVVESTDATTSENGAGYYSYIDNIVPVVNYEGLFKGKTLGSVYVAAPHGIKLIEGAEGVSTLPLFKTTETSYIYTEEIAKATEDALKITDEKEMVAAIEKIIADAPKSVYNIACQSTLKAEEGKQGGTLYWIASPYALSNDRGLTSVFELLVSDTCKTDNALTLIGTEVGEAAVLKVSENASELWGIVTIGALPVIFLGIGAVLWAIRRRR